MVRPASPRTSAWTSVKSAIDPSPGVCYDVTLSYAASAIFLTGENLEVFAMRTASAMVSTDREGVAVYDPSSPAPPTFRLPARAPRDVVLALHDTYGTPVLANTAETRAALGIPDDQQWVDVGNQAPHVGPQPRKIYVSLRGSRFNANTTGELAYLLFSRDAIVNLPLESDNPSYWSLADRVVLVAKGETFIAKSIQAAEGSQP